MRFKRERLRLLKRRHVVAAGLACNVDHLLRLAREHTREIHGSVSCVHGASRPLSNVSSAGELGRNEGKRLSRGLEHFRTSVEHRHEVEVGHFGFGHFGLDLVERRQRVVEPVHGVVQRGEMQQCTLLL